MTEDQLIRIIDCFHIPENSDQTEYTQSEYAVYFNSFRKRPSCYESKLLKICNNENCKFNKLYALGFIDIVGVTCDNDDVFWRYNYELYDESEFVFDCRTCGIRIDVVDYSDWSDCYNDLEYDHVHKGLIGQHYHVESVDCYREIL